MSAVPIFDAHCDTVMKVLDQGADFLSEASEAHISLPRMLAADVRAQVFACFVLKERYPGRAEERAEEMIKAIEGMISSSAGAMAKVVDRSGLADAFSGGPIAALIGLEGADPLGGRAENLRRFFDLGVRDLIFAWKDNPFSGTAFGQDRPLSPEGKRLLGLAEELGVMVDVSHLSDSAFHDVVAMARRPFIASHSNCRAICPHPRNLTDPMIRGLADAGGVMGMNLAPLFLDPEYQRMAAPLVEAAGKPGISEEEKNRLRSEVDRLPRPGLDWAVRHILYAIDVGGEDAVGLGGDLDGISKTPLGIETVADYPRLVDLLWEAGLSERQVEKVCYRNFLRVFEEVLPQPDPWRQSS